MNTILVIVVVLVIFVSALVAYKLGIRKGAIDLAKARQEAADWRHLAEARGASLDFQRRYRRAQELKALGLK